MGLELDRGRLKTIELCKKTIFRKEKVCNQPHLLRKYLVPTFPDWPLLAVCMICDSTCVSVPALMSDVPGQGILLRWCAVVLPVYPFFLLPIATVSLNRQPVNALAINRRMKNRRRRKIEAF
jgi:hypothetical protein